MPWCCAVAPSAPAPASAAAPWSPTTSPYAVVVGNPAKVIRFRFPDKIIESLLRTRWWTLPSDTIKNLPYKDIALCAEVLEEMRAAETQAKSD